MSKLILRKTPKPPVSNPDNAELFISYTYVKYPEIAIRILKLKSKHNRSEVMTGKTKLPPLVVVCGWMKASRRGVQKYADMHTLRYRTTTLESHIPDLFRSPASMHKGALHRIQSLHPTTDELVIIPHMISNGGCISWYALEDHLVKAGIPYRVPAMIFDSSPNTPAAWNPLYAAGGFQALDALTQDIAPPVRRVLIKAALFCMWESAVLYWRLNSSMKNPFARNVERLIIRDAHIPKLFLYSSGDKLVTAQEIQVVIAQAKALGTPVEAKDFKDSDHVSHFHCHSDAYIDLVDTFLKKYTITKH